MAAGVGHDLALLIRLMPPTRRRQLILVAALMPVAALAEMVSVGAIVPFLALLAAPSNASGQAWLVDLLQVAGSKSPEQMLLAAAILFAVAITLATIIRLLLSWATPALRIWAGPRPGRGNPAASAAPALFLPPGAQLQPDTGLARQGRTAGFHRHPEALPGGGGGDHFAVRDCRPGPGRRGERRGRGAVGPGAICTGAGRHPKTAEDQFERHRLSL